MIWNVIASYLFVKINRTRSLSCCSSQQRILDSDSPTDIATVVRGCKHLRLVLLGWKDNHVYAQAEDEDSAFDATKARPIHKDLMQAKYMEQWAAMRLEGEVADAFTATEYAPDACQCPHTTSISLVRDFQRTFAIRAQSNNINCETNQLRWNFAASAACRTCKSGQQGSTFHTLNHCQKRLHLYKARHDAVLDTAVRELKKIKDVHILVDSTPHIEVNGRGTTLRPDIIITKGSRIAILDVKCPFPTRARDAVSFDERVDRENRSKYAPIAADYRAHFSSVSLGTLVIPSAGPIPRRSFQALLDAGLPKSDALKTLRKMASALIRSNALLAYSLPPQELEMQGHQIN